MLNLIMKRRQFLSRSFALGTATLTPAVSLIGLPEVFAATDVSESIPTTSQLPGNDAKAIKSLLATAQIVVIGGGYAGATAAKYLRIFSGNRAQVTLVEPNAEFISCPLSNLVVGGSQSLSALTRSYEDLTKRHGVQVIKDYVLDIEAHQRRVRLKSGASLTYDKLVLCPGISMMMSSVDGLEKANAAGVTLQAWKAGPETVALNKQLLEMRDGGVFALSIPEAPYRCPPGPYERVCQVASLFKQYKPKSKIIVLDANQDVVSKGALFKKAWAELYPGMIDYRPTHNVLAVDAHSKTLKFDIQEDVTADVLNILPSMRAGDVALKSGVANASGRWAHVDFLNFESTAIKHIHVLGDAVQNAPAMPKSGHMANQHAKVAAAAIIAELSDWPINTAPMLTNTCYSFVDATQVVHVASVHAYNATEKTFKVVAGSGGLSPDPSALEGRYAWSWAKNIWADSLS
jgi:NADH dehydrogenase FAD-containing subunit